MSTMAVDNDAPPSAGTDPSDSFVASLPDPLRSYATEALSSPKDGEVDASARLDQLEIATRSHLLELVEQLLSTDGPASSSATHDATMETTLRYLKDVTLLCRHVVKHAALDQPSYAGLATALTKKLPFLLLEDAVDALPLVRIQSLWSSPAYPTLTIDSYTTTLLCSPELFAPTSKLVLLRICNKLLKVLSNRDVDAEFAGRLMTTMAKVFPLSERSAVNVLGSFNVHNETIFEDEAEFVAKKELGMKATADGDKGSSIGYDFYQTFWGVQQVFTDPQGTILSSRGGLNQAQAAAAYTGFVKDVTSILAALESTPLPKSSALSKLDEATSTASGDIVRHHKYLTSSQLLHLQLKDATLRLHFLSQLIIILSYLSSPAVALPAPPITAAAGADTAKLLAQIRTTQSKQLAEVEKRTWQLLRATAPPKGEAMHRSLRWLLRERESMWRNWKRGKCLPSMDKVKKSAVDGTEVKAKLSGRKRKVDSMTMTEGHIAKEDLSKSSVPALSDFLAPYVEALDPENGIEGEYHPRNDTVYSWRALRLLAREQAGADKGVGGHLGRFGDLRRRDGDFEGIVRGIWTERGEEIGGSMGEDYYHDIEEAVEEKQTLANAEMDDVSVGTPQEDEAARKEKLAEFEKAAMDFEEELLNDDVEESGEKEEGKAEEGADAAVKMEDKAEADEKDIRDAAAETIMSMFNEEPEKKKKDEAAPLEPKKEHAVKQETKSSASEKGKADAAAKEGPKKAPKGGQGKNGGGKKDSSSNGKKEEERRSASPARAKFTPPPPKGPKQKTEDTKNEPRDNARGGRHNHRRTNSDQQNQPSSDRRGSGRGAEKHQPSSERGRDGGADGRRGARFQPQQQSQRDARPSGRDGKSRSPPKDTVAHGKGSDHGGGDRRGDRGGTAPAPGKGGDAGGGERRAPPHGGGRGRGNWEPPHGGRGGGGGRGGRGGGRGNYRDRGNRRGGGR